MSDWAAWREVPPTSQSSINSQKNIEDDIGPLKRMIAKENGAAG
ncbi:MAG: hypothetical protein QRY16_20345 [Enterobacterales bacterium endosymbiont of Blomia tropicalis]|nr:hypothetical protein [Mixta mediterraneensis]MDL4916025.1 hypothetical protein [Mixta mediterraneensis]